MDVIRGRLRFRITSTLPLSIVLVDCYLGHSPKGNLFHVAGMVEGSLRVIDVWESQDAFNAFVGVLGPVAQSVGIAQPQVTVWPVHNILTPKGYAIGG